MLPMESESVKPVDMFCFVTELAHFQKEEENAIDTDAELERIAVNYFSCVNEDLYSRTGADIVCTT